MTNATEYIGMTRDAIDTPVLLVDLDALEYNIARLAEHFRTVGKNLRPHTKSHKTPAIAHLQLSAGAQGITCAKVGEAEVMADADIQDILIANEVVGRRKIERLMALAARCDIMVAVDDPQNLADLNEAAHAYKACPRVLVEVNIGHNRCGVAPATVVELARAASQAPHLRFCGLMGYEGHVIDLEDKAARDGGASTCLQRLVAARDDVESAGLDCSICSASGTGDYYISTSYEGITEVQAGSYALMDAAYAKLDSGLQKRPQRADHHYQPPRARAGHHRCRPQEPDARARLPPRQGPSRLGMPCPLRRARPPQDPSRPLHRSPPWRSARIYPRPRLHHRQPPRPPLRAARRSIGGNLGNRRPR